MVSKFGNNVAENIKLIWNKKVQGANTLCLKEKQSEVVCLTSLIKSSHGMSWSFFADQIKILVNLKIFLQELESLFELPT